MFRKLISNLAFSPSLVGQLGFYAKRLRKEEITRRIGLIFTVLALAVQCLAVFQPPESANAASSNDFVPGGLGLGSNRSLNNFLHPYDSNVGGLKDIMNYVGITREEIAASQFSSWIVGDTLSWGHNPKFSYAQGERAVPIINSAGQTTQTVYARPLKLWEGANTRIYGWIGHSQKIGWFAIMQACGNLITNSIPPPPPPPPQPNAICQALSVVGLSRTSYQFNAQGSAVNGAAIKGYTYVVKDASGKIVATKATSTPLTTSSVTQTLQPGTYTVSLAVNTSLGDKTGPACMKQLTVAPPNKCPLNPQLTVEDNECQPCPGDQTIWVKDTRCAAQIIKTKDAFNLDQNGNATTLTADVSQRIRFTVTAKNDGKLAAPVDLTDNLADTLEYSSLIDQGGGTFDPATKTLSWGTVTLQPGQTTDRTFVVKLPDAIPAVAQGSSDGTSYDCVMTNTFGTDTNINVNCPAPKVVEQVVKQLPQTGATQNLFFVGIVLAVVTYFYARARQMKKEVRLIRRDLNAGAI